MALRAHLGGSGQAARHRPDVVGACCLGGSDGVGVELGLFAQHAEGEDDHVEIADSFGGCVNDLGVRSGVKRIEHNGVGVDASRTQAIDRAGR